MRSKVCDASTQTLRVKNQLIRVIFHSSSLHDQIPPVSDVEDLTGLHNIFAGHIDADLLKVFADAASAFDNDGEHHLQKLVGFFGSRSDLFGEKLKLVPEKTIKHFFIIISQKNTPLYGKIIS